VSEGRSPGILSHWCAHPFGPDPGPTKFCSKGCVVADKDKIKTLNQLLDAEPGSTLLVLQAQ